MTSEVFTVRLKPKSRRKLKSYAETQGVSESEAFRQWVDRLPDPGKQFDLAAHFRKLESQPNAEPLNFDRSPEV